MSLYQWRIIFISYLAVLDNRNFYINEYILFNLENFLYDVEIKMKIKRNWVKLMKATISIILSVSIFFHCTSTLAKDDSIGFQIEMLPWEKVNDILPKFSKFTVLDVETGKRFDVQRRAGSRHADVQPLTSEDTKIMKGIYSGKWSWKRRAIIIIHKNQWIAASMHGMPHGAGALENNFGGHFCIHFYGSKTHRKNNMDLSHKLMIFKAAGILKEYANNADPQEVISAYLAGIKQQDLQLISSFSLQRLDGKESISFIENINLKYMSVPPSKDIGNELMLEVPIEIEVFFKNLEKKYLKRKSI